MSTSIYNPSQDSRRSSTTSRHRRSSVSLHSTPGLGLIRTISRDLVHGWHTPTALQKERPSSPSLAPASRAYKPRHAARDVMKGFTPTASDQAEDAAQETATSYFETRSRDSSPRSRQDSLAPISPITADATKPLACVEAGLIPDHSFDTWTAAWDSAYERRVQTNHHCTSASSSISATPANQNKRAKSTRPPLTGRLCITDAEIKRFVFEGYRDSATIKTRQNYESPESFLMPRRGSEVPSLVLSEVSSRDSGLEDLEEGDEESDGEVKVVVNDQGKSLVEEKTRKVEEKRFGRILVKAVGEDL